MLGGPNEAREDFKPHHVHHIPRHPAGFGVPEGVAPPVTSSQLFGYAGDPALAVFNNSLTSTVIPNLQTLLYYKGHPSWKDLPLPAVGSGTLCGSLRHSHVPHSRGVPGYSLVAHVCSFVERHSSILRPNLVKGRDLHLYTDASSEIGFGAYWSGRWFNQRWPSHLKHHSIEWKELYAIVMAARCGVTTGRASACNFTATTKR